MRADGPQAVLRRSARTRSQDRERARQLHIAARERASLTASGSQVEAELKPPSLLVPRGQYDVRPPFMLVGGILFQPLSLEFLQVRARCRTY